MDASTSHSIYSHGNLRGNEFRILRILPSLDIDAPISCTLSIADCYEPEKYAALSYAWDRTHEATTITIDGQSFAVSRTVRKALRDLRALKVERIWIDQICINQRNLSERNQQVARMGQIYSAATNTYVYLGHVSNDIGDIEDFVRWNLAMQVWSTPESILSGKHTFTLTHLDNFGTTPSSFKGILRHIFSHPYFTRCWVLQEVCLSKEVTGLLNGKELPWSAIRALALQIPISDGTSANHAARRSILSQSKIFGGHLLNMFDYKADAGDDVTDDSIECFTEFVLQTEEARGMDLLYLLNRARCLQTTDPRDKIFALLGLAIDVAEYPAPDYTMGVSDVYQLYAKCLARKGHDLKILSLSSFYRTDGIISCSSWVPQWDKPVPSFNYEQHTRFAAGGIALSRTRVRKRSLSIEAHHLGSIRTATSVIDKSSRASTNSITLVSSFRNALVESSQHYGRDVEGLEESLISLLFCDPEDHGSKLFRQENSRLSFAGQFWKSIIHYGTTRALNEEWKYKSPLHALIDRYEDKLDLLAADGGEAQFVRSWEHGSVKFAVVQDARRFIDIRGAAFMDYLGATRNPLSMVCLHAKLPSDKSEWRHTFGLASGHCEPGDEVMIVRGARSPYVLRPCGPDQYRNIGEVYVRGAMMGETIQDRSSDIWRYIEIV